MSIIRSNDGSILFRAVLFDASGNPITTTATLMILHFVPASGDIETYDFNDNTFKTTAVTTRTQNLTHEQADNNTVDTGIHRHRHTTLTDFEIGDKYVAYVEHASLPAPIVAEFQYGDLEGDDALALGGLIRERETAQAGAAGSITLNTNADATNDGFYTNQIVVIIAGTGVGQARLITGYTASSRVADISPNWEVNPDSTSVYIMLPAGEVAASGLTVSAIADGVWDEALSGHLTIGSTGRSLQLGSVILSETTVTGTPTSTTFDLTAGSTVDDFYNDLQIIMLSGAAAGQARIITNYIGATKTVEVDEPWIGAIVATDQVVIRALHAHSLNQIVDGVWDENIVVAHATAQSAGLLLNILGGAIAARSFNATLNDLLGVPDTAASDTAVGQVWEELLASHNTASTMGEVMNDIAASGSPSAATIADAVWDEDIVAAHGTADTAGLLLRALGAVISQRGNNATLDSLLGVPDVASTNLADAIMDEDIVGAHGTAQTLGFIVRQLGAAIAARTNNNNLNALLGVADTAATDTMGFRVWEEVLDAAHVVADSAAERVKAIDDLTQVGGAGDLTDTNSQVQKIDRAAVDATPTADSIADRLDDIDATLTVLDRDLLISVNLEGVDLRIEVAVEQFGVIQTAPWVDAAAQIFDESNGLIHNIGISDFGAIGPRGFFTFTQTNHVLVAGNTYQISVQVTDGAALSISTTKPFKVFQG
jgi:hypothetical protein